MAGKVPRKGFQLTDDALISRLSSFLPYAYENAPGVRKIFDSVKITPADIQSIADLDKIPVTSKDRLAQLQVETPPFGGFLAIPFEKLGHIFLSPGPLYEPHAGESAVTDTIKEMLTISGIGVGDIVLNAFGYHLIPTGYAVDVSLRQLGARVVPVGVGNADLQAKMMHDLGTTAYVGTPSWLLAVLQKAEELGINIPLKKAMVSAEPLPPALRQTLVETYGLHVTNAYGTAELGFLAYNDDGGMAMRLLEINIVQIADPETGKTVSAGETGEVVVTSFNTTYPLIRLGTGDLAVNVDPNPGSSQQGERAIILVGRVGDAVKVRGMFVHPNQLRFAVAQVAGVAHYQAIISREEHRDLLTLKVALKDPNATEREFEEKLRTSIRSACRVNVDTFKFVNTSDLAEDIPLFDDQRTWE